MMKMGCSASDHDADDGSIVQFVVTCFNRREMDMLFLICAHLNLDGQVGNNGRRSNGGARIDGFSVCLFLDV